MASLIVSCLVLCLSYVNAGLFESMDQMAVRNAAECAKLDATECAKVGACYLVGTACTLDPCYDRTLLSSSECPTKTPACGKVKWEGDTNTSFCVLASRVPEFATNASICKLEWGEYKATTWAACKTLTGCGPLTDVPFTENSNNNKYYVCGAGSAPVDPCNGVGEKYCSYIHDCMLVGEVCQNDPCWERTVPGVGNCDPGCGDSANGNKPYPLEIGGYCKTATSPLNNTCNAISGSFQITTELECKAALPSSANCKEVITVKNYDGDTFYVCNPEALEIDAHAVSLNSFVVAILSLIFLVMMI